MMTGPILGGLPRIKFDSGLNVVVDGNSLVAGQGGGEDISKVLAKSQPLATYTALTPNATALGTSPNTGRTNKWQTDKGIIVTNFGINGQTWRQMNGLDGYSAADVDAAFVSSKTNVLVVWEGTNSITNMGRTPAQAIQDATDYIAARQAAVNAAYPGQKWIVVIGTCLPRQVNPAPPADPQAATDALNAKLDTYNALIRSSYLAMGAKAYFDVRQSGGPFDFQNYLISTFEAAASASGTLWAASETGAHTHLNSDGYTTVARNFIIPALRLLPAR